MLERSGTSESNLAQMDEKAWRAVRGREVAMVFQEPMTSLNPVMRIGAQIEEAIRTHEPALSKDQARHRVLEALRHASVPEAEVRAEQFPHQLSCAPAPRVRSSDLLGVSVEVGSSEQLKLGTKFVRKVNR